MNAIRQIVRRTASGSDLLDLWSDYKEEVTDLYEITRRDFRKVFHDSGLESYGKFVWVRLNRQNLSFELVLDEALGHVEHGVVSNYIPEIDTIYDATGIRMEYPPRSLYDVREFRWWCHFSNDGLKGPAEKWAKEAARLVNFVRYPGVQAWKQRVQDNLDSLFGPRSAKVLLTMEEYAGEDTATLKVYVKARDKDPDDLLAVVVDRLMEEYNLPRPIDSDAHGFSVSRVRLEWDFK